MKESTLFVEREDDMKSHAQTAATAVPVLLLEILLDITMIKSFPLVLI